jgi:hypothetical protein
VVKVFVTYRLKPGVTWEDYEKWSIEVDQPTAGHLPGIIRYEIYRIEGASEGEPFCDVVEDIEVESWADWADVNSYPVMQRVVEGWKALSDQSTVNMVYGSAIRPTTDPSAAGD